ncbi:hypothetical protein C7999DRAFT_12850 [Corynascus novoguineensis]|uniref:Uncharacterized protein n=1 Tax=Corynascus novoguineensis TaxID=1126955 RepID=A0AAN7HRT1_9PEZI|nr:hypothetical protein C7999DRAFT_12850 [Corynascus novoguineensis]
MTLGSALLWRACSPRGRIQQRFAPTTTSTSPAAPRNPPVVRRHAHLAALSFFRAQSTASGRPKPLRRTRLPHEPPSESLPTQAPSSLVERLSRVPVRPHDPYGSVVVKPVIQYPHKRENREALLKHHRAYTQQLRLEQRRPPGARTGDWRAALNKLIKWTPPHERHGRIKVVIPKHSVALLLSDHERNLWNIKSRTECDMTLYRPADEAAPFDPYVILSGQPTAMTAAVDDILKVSKGVTVVNLDEFLKTGVESSQAGQPPTQGLNDSAFAPTKILPHQMSVSCRPYRLNVRADQIPRPSEWTVEAFQQYTAALVMGNLDARRARQLYRDGETHKETVVRQLHAAFYDPAASTAVSLPALKLALRYLTAAGATHLKDAQSLFDRAEELGLRVNTDTYNLIAEMSVKSKNLPAFDSTVSQMVRHGYKPNLRTWLLFLRLVEAEEVRRYILQAMDTKTFFSDPAALNGVAGIMADHDAYRAVQQGQSFDDFIAGLRELYGPEWQLTLRAANRYLDVFGQHSKFNEMRQLVGYMFASEQSKPTTISLNTVITRCKHQRKVDPAVDLVRMFNEHGYDVADRTTFHLLYELARKTRKPHLLGAVWRYAHRVGMTNHRMQVHGIKVLAGERESARLTDRIRGVWEKPRSCAISRQEFMENLFLCDYKTSRSDLRTLLQKTENRIEEAQDVPNTTSRPPPDGNSIPAQSANRADPGTQFGTPAGDKEQASLNMPSNDGAPGAIASHLTPRLTAAEMYELYARAMSKAAERFVPSIPLGIYLQQALDRDRNLHRLARAQGIAANDDKALRANVDPIELPVVRRKGPMFDQNGLLRWLAERKEEEEEAATAVVSQQDGAVEDPGVIDVRWVYQENSRPDGSKRDTMERTDGERAPDSTASDSTHSTRIETTTENGFCRIIHDTGYRGGSPIFEQPAAGRS